MTAITGFLVVAATFLFHMTEGGQLCGLCTQMVDPRDCDVVGECGAHEECIISKYLSPTGHLLYDMRCESSFACPSGVGRRNPDVPKSSSLVRAGNVMICSTCCNDTQLCNVINGHCNSPVLDLTGSVLCYNCDYMHSQDQCDRITACPVHEQCYIGQSVSGLSGAVLWTSRCGHGRGDCVTDIPIDGVIGKRQLSPFCSTCCKDNFCNNKCSVSTPPTTTTESPTTTVATPTTHPLSKPVITFVTRLHDVKLGSYIHLTCRASGIPTPSMAWQFLTLGDLPTNIRVMNNGAYLYIDNVNAHNYGHYACKASNSQGSDIRYVDVLEHGPSHRT